MSDERWTFIALAAATVLGLILSLSYAWLINPVELYNTTPDLLRSDYLHEWVRLASLSYAVDGDLERAETRLEPIPQAETQAALAALIENYVAQGRSAQTIRAISRLAEELGVYTPAMDAYLNAAPPPSPTPVLLPTPDTPTPIPPTPTPTLLPPPTQSPLPTPLPSPYRVVSQTLVCEGAPPQLQILVRAIPTPEEVPEDEGDEEPEPPEPTPLPGVVLWLTWPNGADRAVTGLRPEIDPGYADFDLATDTPYALSVDEPNAPVISGLVVEPCLDGETDLGTWRVVLEVDY